MLLLRIVVFGRHSRSLRLLGHVVVEPAFPLKEVLFALGHPVPAGLLVGVLAVVLDGHGWVRTTHDSLGKLSFLEYVVFHHLDQPEKLIFTYFFRVEIISFRYIQMRDNVLCSFFLKHFRLHVDFMVELLVIVLLEVIH